LNPHTEVKVETANSERGPLLILSGEMDHTVPWALAHGAYKRQQHNPGLTEITQVPGRGHALTIDHCWSEVAVIVLDFFRKVLVPVDPATATSTATD
jgi:non-heme chloroperoxidase